MNNSMLLLLALLMIHSVALSQLPPFQPRLVDWQGSRIWSPKATGSGKLYQTPSGISLDSTTSNISIYASGNETGGVIQSNCVVSAIFKLDRAYTPVSPSGSYPGQTGAHAGIGTRWTNNNDFAGLVMLTAETTNAIQIVDRIGGVELLTTYQVPGAISYGTRYRLRLDARTNDAIGVNLWNYDSGALITNFTYTITNTALRTGTVFVHAYSCSMTLSQLLVENGSGGARYHESRYFVLDPQSSLNNGYWVSNTVLRHFCNGSSNSDSAWSPAVVNFRARSGRLSGTMKPVSGRNHGIIITGTSAGDGQAIYWDQSAGAHRLATNLNSSPTVTTLKSVPDLLYGTNYSWTLSFLSSTTFSWSIHGQTSTWTNSGFSTTNDLVGVIGYNSLTEFGPILSIP